jgi:large subunit ribosomal protein L7/L12
MGMSCLIEEVIPMSAVTKEQVVSFIENMSVIDLSNLVKELETKFGVSAAATVSAGAAGPAAEAKTEFNVVLVSLATRRST